MTFNLSIMSRGCGPIAHANRRNQTDRSAITGCIQPSSNCHSRETSAPVRSSALAGLLAAGLLLSISGNASAQSVSPVGGPQPAIQTQAKKPMTPHRLAWLKARCSQLVAFYDRWGVGRGENSDGPRNHTRIGAALECEKGNYRYGIDTMDTLIVGKAFDVPRHLAPVHEPEDIEAPDITNPTRPWYWFQAQKVQQVHHVQQAQQP